MQLRQLLVLPTDVASAISPRMMFLTGSPDAAEAVVEHLNVIHDNQDLLGSIICMAGLMGWCMGGNGHLMHIGDGTVLMAMHHGVIGYASYLRTGAIAIELDRCSVTFNERRRLLCPACGRFIPRNRHKIQDACLDCGHALHTHWPTMARELHEMTHMRRLILHSRPFRPVNLAATDT